MSSKTLLRHHAFIVLAVILCVTSSCRTADNLPKKSSKEYNDAVKSFYVGLAALQVGDDYVDEEHHVLMLDELSG